MKQKLLALALCLGLLLPAVPVKAAEARELSSRQLITDCRNLSNLGMLFDGRLQRNLTGGANASLTLSAPEGIGSIYVIFQMEYGEYQLVNEDTGEKVTCGRENFLHEYIDVTKAFGSAPRSVTLRFGEKAPQLNELRVFSEGEPPADVQRWKRAPEEGVDLMIFSTHGDDEQLFFAGVLPYYAGELGYEVQVAYLTRHPNYGPGRSHEMLDGLWAVGVTNYPVSGGFEDYYCKSKPHAYQAFADRGITEDQLLSYVVEQLRRYKPLVALGHDEHGEYGHGMHQLFSELLRRGVEVSGDPRQFPETAEKWGTWDVPKTYLRLYPENPVHMDWDRPLSHFDGMTAYEVTKTYGFPAHASQYQGFAWYFESDTAEGVEKYGPCDFGLYRSTVGEDVQKDDFFENLVNREEQKRLEEEARQQVLEEQRRKELQKQEEKRRAEEEQQRKEEEASLAAQAQAARERVFLAGGISAAAALILCLILLLRHWKKRQ